MKVKTLLIANYPIPNKLNSIILIASVFIHFACLYYAQIYFLTWSMIPFVVLFSYINNTLFSLFHESVHGALYSNRNLNDFIGRFLAFFFPTSFSLQQIYHLGHHRRNRTDDEMFDLYYENEKRWPKKMTIFGLMSGLYWSSAFFSCLVFLFIPWLFRNPKFVNSRFNKTFKFEAMLKGANKKSTPVNSIRIETIFMLFFWLSIFYFTPITFSTWMICFWAFGLNWGSLQYTDHAFTKRDIRNGAWNLKINPLIRSVFLNYHFHKVHHQYPNLSWYYLPLFVDKSEEMPSFLFIYFRLWRGPELTTEKNPILESFEDKEFEKSIYSGTRYS
jgi:fatty acid desaturase